MHSFKEYQFSLTESLFLEQILLEEKKQKASNDEGVLHELLLAKHLSKEKNLPEHHRSENEEYAGTPQQVHDRLRKKVGEEKYAQIEHGAKKTAEAVHDHIERNNLVPHGHEFHSVFWTSNRDTEKKAGDHEKTTGVKDVHSNADLILLYKHPKTGALHHIGISAKYGNSADTRESSPGMERLEKESGNEPGSMSSHGKRHRELIKKLGHTEEHDAELKAEEEAHKKKRSTAPFMPKSKGAKIAYQVKLSKGMAQRAVSKQYSTGLAKKSDEELRGIVRSHLGRPTTAIPHITAHTRTDKAGEHVQSHVQPQHEKVEQHLNGFSNIHAATDTSGTSSIIRGTINDPGNKRHGKIGTVMTMNFKTPSSAKSMYGAGN